MDNGNIGQGLAPPEPKDSTDNLGNPNPTLPQLPPYPLPHRFTRRKPRLPRMHGAVPGGSRLGKSGKVTVSAYYWQVLPREVAKVVGAEQYVSDVSSCLI